MRYFIKTDANENPVCVFRFNSDEWKSKPGVEIIEEVYNNKDKKWKETDSIARFLYEGDPNVTEVKPAVVGKHFPGAI